MILIIPFLLALPIGGAIYDCISNQNCQEYPQELSDSCCCTTETIQNSDNSCCCAKSKPNNSDNISYITVSNNTEFSIDLQFDFFASFDVVKKISYFNTSNIYDSNDILPTEKFIFYFPPIYQQNCSLRI